MRHINLWKGLLCSGEQKAPRLIVAQFLDGLPSGGTASGVCCCCALSCGCWFRALSCGIRPEPRAPFEGASEEGAAGAGVAVEAAAEAAAGCDAPEAPRVVDRRSGSCCPILLPPLLRRRARTRPRGLPSPAWELPGPPACAAADSAAVSAAPIEDTPDEGLLAGSEEPAVPAGAAPPGAASVPNPVVAAGVPDAVGAEGAPSAGASSDCISSPSMSMPTRRRRRRTRGAISGCSTRAASDCPPPASSACTASIRMGLPWISCSKAALSPLCSSCPMSSIS
mmetsp:Transcript_15472/g.46703  ORF Transcript_15472/g.46703 Transcript_15472/m.46703 type:complete len:281 (-) Transcript_15472:480-1322(-)